MRRFPSSFSLLLPALSLTLTIVFFFGIAARRYEYFRRTAQGRDEIRLVGQGITMEIKAKEFRPMAALGAAFRLERPIIVLDFPGHFGALAISYAFYHGPFSGPSFLSAGLWECITYTLFALPAWWFVGLGIDSLFGRRHMGGKSAVVGLTIGILFTVAATGLRFGMSPEQRREQDQLPFYIAGLYLWGLLFVIPFAGWLRQRFSRVDSSQTPAA